MGLQVERIGVIIIIIIIIIITMFCGAAGREDRCLSASDVAGSTIRQCLSSLHPLAPSEYRCTHQRLHCRRVIACASKCVATHYRSSFRGEPSSTSHSTTPNLHAWWIVWFLEDRVETAFRDKKKRWISIFCLPYFKPLKATRRNCWRMPTLKGHEFLVIG